MLNQLSCRLALLFVACWPLPVGAQIDAKAAKPPVAKMVPRSQTLHGETLIDNYFWLREKTNKEVIAHLDAENAYTKAVMKPTEKFQDSLYTEILGRIKQTDLGVPYRLGEYWYYSRMEKGKQYAIFCRKRGSLKNKEEIILDGNEQAKGQKFFSLGAFQISNDGNLLAFSTDYTGFRVFTLRFKDLRTGKMLPDEIVKTNSIAWAGDNKTVFYVTDDAAKRAYRLYRHVLGRKKDKLLFEEKDELYRIGVQRSRDRKLVYLVSASSTSTEYRYLPAGQPRAKWQVILPREKDHRYYVEHRNGRFYIRTNKKALNFRLVSAPVDNPAENNWQNVVRHRSKVFLENFDVFANHCVVMERKGGLQRMRVINFETNQTHYVPFAEPIFSVFPANNPEFYTAKFRFSYQSLVTPSSVFDYHLAKKTMKLLKKTEVKGGYDPSQFTSERIFAVAKDGTKVPISLVYKKGLTRDGSSPLFLNGYGAYGSSSPITFSPVRLVLLERGVIYAIAHIRGGREMGQAWHDQGKMMNKRNTFTDFIASAEHLIANKYTCKERMAIQGGSAGGLLIGAVLNLKPDLCKAAVLQVPFVDVINTMLDESLPLTVGEFLEWGNPKVKKEYDYIRTYCPYSNIAAKAYPAILVTTSLNDSQVMYWEPAKYVAKLRAHKTDSNPLLFKINMAGGHGGFSGRYDQLKDTAFTYAFVLDQMGIRK